MDESGIAAINCCNTQQSSVSSKPMISGSNAAIKLATVCHKYMKTHTKKKENILYCDPMFLRKTENILKTPKKKKKKIATKTNTCK